MNSAQMKVESAKQFDSTVDPYRLVETIVGVIGVGKLISFQRKRSRSSYSNFCVYEVYCGNCGQSGEMSSTDLLKTHRPKYGCKLCVPKLREYVNNLKGEQ